MGAVMSAPARSCDDVEACVSGATRHAGACVLAAHRSFHGGRIVRFHRQSEVLLENSHFRFEEIRGRKKRERAQFWSSCVSQPVSSSPKKWNGLRTLSLITCRGGATFV